MGSHCSCVDIPVSDLSDDDSSDTNISSTSTSTDPSSLPVIAVVTVVVQTRQTFHPNLVPITDESPQSNNPSPLNVNYPERYGHEVEYSSGETTQLTPTNNNDARSPSPIVSLCHVARRYVSASPFEIGVPSHPTSLSDRPMPQFDENIDVAARSTHNVSPLEVHASNPLSLPPFHRHSGNSFRQLAADATCHPMPQSLTNPQSLSHNSSRLSTNKSLQSVLSSIGGTMPLAEGFEVGSHPIRLPVVFLSNERTSRRPDACGSVRHDTCPANTASVDLAPCVAHVPGAQSIVGKGATSDCHCSEDAAWESRDGSTEMHYAHSGSGWLRDRPAVVLGTQDAIEMRYGDAFRFLEQQCTTAYLSPKRFSHADTAASSLFSSPAAEQQSRSSGADENGAALQPMRFSSIECIEY